MNNVMTGRMPWRGHETWYEVTGDLKSGRTPLVILHGGPGSAHDYLSPMTGLADDGRAVVQYDQLGCGLSSHLPDAPSDFWTIDLFLEELDSLLSHLGIADDYVVLGHSWGGMLGAEHALRQPAGLRGLVLSNSLASSDLWGQGAQRLRALLAPEVEAVLDRHEAAGTFSDPEYLAAVETYYSRHVCRVPFPDYAQRSFDQMASDPTVYNTMWGPNEFAPLGSLTTWTVVDRLSKISVPTLTISGEFDEATWECVTPFVELIPGARQIIVPDASHFSHIEQPDVYFSAVRSFLAEVEAR